MSPLRQAPARTRAPIANMTSRRRNAINAVTSSSSPSRCSVRSRSSCAGSSDGCCGEERRYFRLLADPRPRCSLRRSVLSTSTSPVALTTTFSRY
jgi:hypothetical protein